jgi:hypothetical protein
VNATTNGTPHGTAGDTHAGLAAPARGADERRLARAVFLTLAAVAVPILVVSYLVVGWQGVASAAAGIGLVTLLFGGSVLLLVRVADRDSGVGLLALGPVVRLPLYAIALLALTNLEWVHGRTLAAATGAAVAVTLAVELRLLARSPGLFSIDPDATPTGPNDAATDTRSQTL